MKNSLFIFMFFIGISASNANPLKKPIDPKKEKKILEIIFNQLKAEHLLDKKIDDGFSRKVFKNYLYNIDPYKIFFLQSDFDEFKKFETKLDDQLINNYLTFFYLTYDRIKLRMTEGKKLYLNVCKNNVDIKEKDIDFDVKKLVIDNTKAKQTKKWKLVIKSEVFAKTIETCLLENKKNNLNKKQFDSVFDSSVAVFLNSFVERMEKSGINVDNFNREEFFGRYLNSIISLFDIHSEYLIPSKRDEYLIKQSGKIEGIGVQFDLTDSFVKISSITVGAPAWKTKKVDVGDIILKVGQENDVPIDVVGFNLYPVAKLIRGKTGTTVRLTLKKSDGAISEVAIKRGIVTSNDSFIKSCLVEKNKVKYGVLSFPRFYNDFDDDLVRNAADDFEDELQILKESEVQGIVIDIRNNEGGSLEATIKILSNFVDKTTIVQVKNKENNIFKFDSELNLKKWNKSVVLVVNHETASAAEIFASAFQEFNLGIVIGRETFGKGTIQEIIDLNLFNSKKEDKDDFGMLKITTQRFYKLNGSSVQQIGVRPNVIFPQFQNEIREIDRPNTLTADQIKACVPVAIYDTNYSQINSRAKSRIANTAYFEALKKIKPTAFDFSTNAINYNLIKNKLFEFILKQNSITSHKTTNNLEFKSTPADIKLFKRSEYLISKRKNWYNELKSDMILEQGLNVLEDMYLKK